MNLSPFTLWLLGNIAIAWVIVSLVFLISLIRKRIIWKIDKLVALSVGLILSIIFLGFLPDAIIEWWLNIKLIGSLILTGVFIFYTLELFLHWHHCKDIDENGHSHHNHDHQNSPLIALGTFFGNAVHGIVLFSAFSVNIHFGITTTFAILLHAVPQNIANLLMNHKDTTYVYIAAIWGIFWALLLFPFQSFLSQYNFHILMIVAGWLLYTAMSDILPSFKEKWKLKHKFLYLVCMILGILLFSITSNFL